MHDVYEATAVNDKSWLEQLIEDSQKDQVAEYHAGRPFSAVVVVAEIVGAVLVVLLAVYMVMTL